MPLLSPMASILGPAARWRTKPLAEASKDTPCWRVMLTPMPEASGELASQPTPGWVDRVIQFARVDLVVPGLIPASYGVGPGKVIFPHRRGRVHDPQVGDGHRYGRTLRFRHIRAPLVISADFRSTIAVPPKLDVEANSLFQSGGAGSQITVYWHSVSWCSSSVLVISGVR